MTKTVKVGSKLIFNNTGGRLVTRKGVKINSVLKKGIVYTVCSLDKPFQSMGHCWATLNNGTEVTVSIVPKDLKKYYDWEAPGKYESYYRILNELYEIY